MPSDKRKPKLRKIGCWFAQCDRSGFHFFNRNETVKDGDVFIHNKGMFFKIERE